MLCKVYYSITILYEHKNISEFHACIYMSYNIQHYDSLFEILSSRLIKSSFFLYVLQLIKFTHSVRMTQADHWGQMPAEPMHIFSHLHVLALRRYSLRHATGGQTHWQLLFSSLGEVHDVVHMGLQAQMSESHSWPLGHQLVVLHLHLHSPLIVTRSKPGPQVGSFTWEGHINRLHCTYNYLYLIMRYM